MTTVRTARTVRAALLASAAGLCLVASAAQAEINDPTTDPTGRTALDDGWLQAQSARPTVDTTLLEAQTSRPTTDTSLLQAQAAPVAPVAPEPEIVIGFPGTPTTARDPNNVTGVGQMIVDEQNGFIGLCTGTLINPRTVIFAAHCVNERPANAYGQNSGGQPIAFGFSNSNNTAGNSAFGQYLNGARQYQTNTANFLYDVNYVAYNPRSLEPDAAGFLYADVALATLDTPAKNIPTWALLFSPLPNPGTIGANGTGYHVVIEGYGNNGTGTTGSTGGIDYRRRIAENMLGALASLDDFEGFLFGAPASGLTQNLYWIDFDDPRRGTASADIRDFNAWRDNPQPNEGITASGDSGGPLILDRAFAKQVVIGVLSGGYTRFFNGAPANGYGTASFYQPLYLYWDWVAANNPYHYVSAVAGNGNWTDPAHWVSNVDPNYQIIGPNGQLVTGVPTSPGAGTADQPGFGQACFEGAINGGVSECYDIATGTTTIVVRPIGTGDSAVPVTDGTNGPALVSVGSLTGGELGNDLGTVDIGSLTGSTTQVVSRDQAVLESQDGGDNVGALALPAATIDNGLPGATNFVPNNSDGNRLTSTKPRYFDVTLSATGITTLNTAVTIDRFGLNGAGAMLDITSTGSLTSLMDINQITGTMQVNGTLTSPGDYFMMAGGLNGTGTITTPFFTSVAGTISPGASGTAGNVGTLTFRGNIILSTGNTYMVDLGTNGTSDRIVVQSNGTGTGVANIGGRLVLNYSQATLRAGNTYTILTAQGGLSGTTFQSLAALSAILQPKLTYSANAVVLTIQANLYGNIIPTSDRVGFAYAKLLDRNRVNQGLLDGIYGVLDFQSAGTIRATLDGLAPTTETLIQSLALVGVDNHGGLVRERLDQLDPGATGGTFARYGQPTQVAATGLARNSLTGLGSLGYGTDIRSDAGTPMVQEGVLPEGVSAFVAGGYLNGDSAPMLGVAGRDTYDGWYVATGIETWDDQAGIGFTVSAASLDGDAAFPGNTARADLFQGSLYGKIRMRGVTLDATLTAGLLDTATRRSVTFVTSPVLLRSESGSLILTSEVGLSTDFDLGAARITPRVAGRATHVGFSRTTEYGGNVALVIDRSPVESVQGRAGITIAGTGNKVRPFVNGTYVHEFEDRTTVIGANFVNGVGGNVLFDLNSMDADYGEISGGLTVDTGNIDLSLSAQTTIGRDDYSGQAYRASMTFKF